MASGYHVYFSGDCSGVKRKKGQHGVGLPIKEEIVKKTDKDGIAIECISTRLLKVRVSFKFNFVGFVVAHTPPKKAPDGQKAIYYMAALISTIELVPAWEYVFVLSDANAMTGIRG